MTVYQSTGQKCSAPRLHEQQSVDSATKTKIFKLILSPKSSPQCTCFFRTKMRLGKWLNAQYASMRTWAQILSTHLVLSACLHSCGESETGPPGTTGHQPNSKFSKRPCHRSKQKANRLGCRASYYGLLVHTHIFIDHTWTTHTNTKVN